jgi:hypothetical protein
VTSRASRSGRTLPLSHVLAYIDLAASLARKHSLLLLLPLFPESSLGVLVEFARCVLSTCEDMAIPGTTPQPWLSTTQWRCEI